MVERQLKRRGISDAHILNAFRAVPREAFVSADAGASRLCGSPAADRSQTDNLPALYRRADARGSGDRPGATACSRSAPGSGYAAAVIRPNRRAEVVGIERQHELVQIARERMRRLGYGSVGDRRGRRHQGWPDGAPYDAILAAASGSHVPKSLIEQLKPGGRIVMPLGDPGWVQTLIKIEKRADGTLQQSGSRWRTLRAVDRRGGLERLATSLSRAAW